MLYPDLSSSNSPLVVDIETFDPNLKTHGPSNYREGKNKGRIVGVALSDGDFTEYYPLHGNKSIIQDSQSICFFGEDAKSIKYLKEVLKSSRPKIGHNILYDVDWLEAEGFTVNGQLHDTSTLENLIDENQETFALDALGTKYFNEGKTNQEMIDWCLANDVKLINMYDHIWEMPVDIVSKYAKQDAILTYRLFNKQMKIIQARELEDIYKLESDLIKVMLLMRQTGVPYDSELSLKNSFGLYKKVEAVSKILKDKFAEVNPRSAKQLAFWFDKLQIEYPKAPKGGPSIKKEFLEALVENDDAKDAEYLPRLVLQERTYGKSERDYLYKLREEFVCPDNKIHCNFHATRFDGNGTRSGRFSSSKPNLQQVTSPDRDAFLGTKCREPFVPLPGHWWGKIDYSQIEYRFIAHYATGPGADGIRAAYVDNKDQDYHQYIMDRTGLARPFAKNLNFGIAFGMGAKKMATTFGWSMSEAYKVLEQYHENVPFVKSTIDQVTGVSKRRGYIKTILGRHCHIPSQNKGYVMFNRLAQGSAADLMKKAIVSCHKAGIFEVLPLHLTVHDELDVSIPKSAKGLKAFADMKHIMETCVEIKVPIVCKESYGNNWADLSYDLEVEGQEEYKVRNER